MTERKRIQLDIYYQVQSFVTCSKRRNNFLVLVMTHYGHKNRIMKKSVQVFILLEVFSSFALLVSTQSKRQDSLLD